MPQPTDDFTLLSAFLAEHAEEVLGHAADSPQLAPEQQETLTRLARGDMADEEERARWVRFLCDHPEFQAVFAGLLKEN